MTAHLVPDDLEWEDPAGGRGTTTGLTERLTQTMVEMRSALQSRPGKWAVLDTFTKLTAASICAGGLRKKQRRGDSRLAGLEFAARKILDTGGSKLYVRHAPHDDQ